MDDLISKLSEIRSKYNCFDESEEPYYRALSEAIKVLSAQPEKTEYIPDTKAVRSKRDCVDLAERVTATFYDQEYEEWTQRTVTIADVLDSVCDEYTILPIVQPDIDTSHLQKEQAYLQGWEDGREALRKEIWGYGRDRLN